jgi:glycosyltransferase involved in cell wall biosynthesis
MIKVQRKLMKLSSPLSGDKNLMVFVLGTRGLPSRHGGFETLAENLYVSALKLNLKCAVPRCAPTVSGRGSSWLVRVMSRLNFPPPIWTILHSFSVPQNSVVVVTNVSNVFSAVFLKLRVQKVILNIDGFDEKRAKWGVVIRSIFRSCRRIAISSKLDLISDSCVMQNYLSSSHSRTSLYIPYGGCVLAENDLEHRWTPNRDSFYLVVARIEPENQILEICRAILSAAGSLNLIVVGAPVKPTAYWKRLESLSRNDSRVHFAGAIYDRDRRCDLYRSARAVIHGHTVGGTNPSLVDALSHGCPVLAHDNLFNREVADSSALYWKNEDELVHLLNDDSLVYPQIDTDQFIEKYNWADVTKRYFRALGLDVESQRS